MRQRVGSTEADVLFGHVDLLRPLGFPSAKLPGAVRTEEIWSQ